MAALDLLGRRWSLRIIWELRDDPATFRALRERCGAISPSVLNARLHELRAARVLDRADGGYALTGAGRALIGALAPLDAWARDWAHELAGET